MTNPNAHDAMYHRRSFDADIVELCVRWYITYRLSYRDLVAMMAERGVEVSHTTILRWVVRYVPEFEKRRNRHARHGSSWRVDETYVPFAANGIICFERPSHGPQARRIQMVLLTSIGSAPRGPHSWWFQTTTLLINSRGNCDRVP